MQCITASRCWVTELDRGSWKGSEAVDEKLGTSIADADSDRFSRDRPRFNDTLDVIKFLCKDLWSLVFGKNIDNLKTNHRVRSYMASPGCIALHLFGLRFGNNRASTC